MGRDHPWVSHGTLTANRPHLLKLEEHIQSCLPEPELSEQNTDMDLKWIFCLSLAYLSRLDGKFHFLKVFFKYAQNLRLKNGKAVLAWNVAELSIGPLTKSFSPSFNRPRAQRAKGSYALKHHSRREVKDITLKIINYFPSRIFKMYDSAERKVLAGFLFVT